MSSMTAPAVTALERAKAFVRLELARVVNDCSGDGRDQEELAGALVAVVARALREPDEAMLEAWAKPFATGPNGEQCFAETDDAWRIGIDSILVGESTTRPAGGTR